MDLSVPLTKGKVILNASQINRLSEIAASTGLLVLGSVVLPAVIEDSYDFRLLLVGLPLTIGFCGYSIWLLRNKSSLSS